MGVYQATMWFTRIKSFMMGLLLITIVFMWVCSHTCQVEATIPTSSSKGKLSYGVLDEKSKQDLVHKYFGGTRAFGPPSIKTTQNGFEDSKRRVPSCPDPLHN